MKRALVLIGVLCLMLTGSAAAQDGSGDVSPDTKPDASPDTKPDASNDNESGGDGPTAIAQKLLSEGGTAIFVDPYPFPSCPPCPQCPYPPHLGIPSDLSTSSALDGIISEELEKLSAEQQELAPKAAALAPAIAPIVVRAIVVQVAREVVRRLLERPAAGSGDTSGDASGDAK